MGDVPSDKMGIEEAMRLVETNEDAHIGKNRIFAATPVELELIAPRIRAYLKNINALDSLRRIREVNDHHAPTLFMALASLGKKEDTEFFAEILKIGQHNFWIPVALIGLANIGTGGSRSAIIEFIWTDDPIDNYTYSSINEFVPISKALGIPGFDEGATALQRMLTKYDMKKRETNEPFEALGKIGTAKAAEALVSLSNNFITDSMCKKAIENALCTIDREISLPVLHNAVKANQGHAFFIFDVLSSLKDESSLKIAKNILEDPNCDYTQAMSAVGMLLEFNTKESLLIALNVFASHTPTQAELSARDPINTWLATTRRTNWDILKPALALLGDDVFGNLVAGLQALADNEHVIRREQFKLVLGDINSAFRERIASINTRAAEPAPSAPAAAQTGEPAVQPIVASQPPVPLEPTLDAKQPKGILPSLHRRPKSPSTARLGNVTVFTDGKTVTIRPTGGKSIVVTLPKPQPKCI